MPINEDENNKIILFKHNVKEIFTCLTDKANEAEVTFTSSIKISNAGNVGDFTIVNRDSNRSFNFAYSTSIWSVSNTEIVSCKHIEIAP